MALATPLNILRFLSDLPKLFRELVSEPSPPPIVDLGVRRSDSERSNDRSELMMEKDDTETDSLSTDPRTMARNEASTSIESSGGLRWIIILHPVLLL